MDKNIERFIRYAKIDTQAYIFIGLGVGTYGFAKGQSVDCEDATKIVAITAQPFLKLPYEDGKMKYTYVVTALDRLQNESKGVKKKVKL